MLPFYSIGAGGWIPTRAELDRALTARKKMCYRIVAFKKGVDENWLDYCSWRSQRVKAIWMTNGTRTWDRLILTRIHSWAGHTARYEDYNDDSLCFLASCWRDSQYMSFGKPTRTMARGSTAGIAVRPGGGSKPCLSFLIGPSPGPTPLGGL